MGNFDDFDAFDSFDSSLPPSHQGWILLNGEVGGQDPEFSLRADSNDQLHRGMEALRQLGCEFYRWTRVDGGGVLDGWLQRPRFQGRVGYGSAVHLEMSGGAENAA